MEGDHTNQEAAKLLEDAWFFGNSLKNKPKIMRCNSEPSKKAEIIVHKKNASSLTRAPSLPPKFGRRKGNLGDEEEDDFGPRMGDLIRQAMPNKLSKTPSLPIYRTKTEVSFPKMSKLSRISSLDPSLLMPTKYKGIREIKPRKSIMRSISLKSLSDKEVQGFQDLGFTFDNEDLCPIVVDKLARLEIKKETDTETQWAYSPPVPKWVDTKSSAQDMKDQIKFWAKSVASNANQEW